MISNEEILIRFKYHHISGYLVEEGKNLSFHRYDGAEWHIKQIRQHPAFAGWEFYVVILT